MGIELDHIGIAVRNLDERTPFWIALGLIQGEDESLLSDGVNARFLSTDGESQKPVNVELLEPISSDSPIGRFIEKRGEGIQQIAFRVDDINSTISKLIEHGVEMIDLHPRTGAHGSLIAFVHPKSTGGVLVELCEH